MSRSPAFPIGLKLNKEDVEYLESVVRRETELRVPDTAELLTHRLFDAMPGEPPNHCHLSGGIAPANWTGWNIYAPPLGKGCVCALIGITGARARGMIESGEGFDLSKNPPEGGGPDPGWTRKEGWWEEL